MKTPWAISCASPGINRPEEFRTVTWAHIIAWRDDLTRRGLGGRKAAKARRRIGDHQARELLAAPQKDTIKSKRDRAILSTPVQGFPRISPANNASIH
jgi:integrase/recombinase XerD